MAQLLIVFTLGYIVGGVSALILIGFTLAAHTEPTDRGKTPRTS